MQNEALSHRRQIDGLRAFAVMLVLFSHFWIQDTYAGPVGVRLFFVISGYLITLILLRCRESSPDPWRSLLHFVARRALRIFPIYYGLAAIVLLFNIEGSRDYSVWILTHTMNWAYALQGQITKPWIMAHTWTLSVEEQFYLVWPLIVLFTPARFLVAVVCGFFLVGVAVRTADLAFDWGGVMVQLTTPASFDALAAGAFLACFQDDAVVRRWIHRIGAVCAVAAGFALAGLVFVEGDLPFYVLYGVHVFILLAVVSLASLGMNGIPDLVLGNRIVVAIGKISYGIYVYHLFALYLIFKALAYFEKPMLQHGPELFLYATTLTFVMAVLSWFAVEAPLLRWKRRFPYVEEPSPALSLRHSGPV